MVDIRGYLTCNGQIDCHIAEQDDTMVARFRAAGAIIVGLTIMTEGGVSPLGYSKHFSGPHSAYSRLHYSGGSSSGSAVAVATGLVPIAIGFDGGGSIRIPASMSGVHGLATTFGRIPFDGSNPLSTMIKAGPFASSAKDVALAYELLALSKPGHFYSTLYDGDNYGPPPPHTAGMENIQDLSDVRIGIYREWFNDADKRVVELCMKAVAMLQSRGATVVDIIIPHLHAASLSHGIKISSEFALLFDKYYHTAKENLESNTRITVGLGASVSALEVTAAERLRAWSFRYIQNLYADHNLTVIITPTCGVLPPELSAEAKEEGESNIPLTLQVMKYIFLANFLGMPGYSVPVGHIRQQSSSSLELPVGLHLLGNHWTEHVLLRIANALDSKYQGMNNVTPHFFTDNFAL
jgi:Asp-tRNA(Asn)/Glu-tRNA(Gln) amidotransferase A subunit family amidase